MTDNMFYSGLTNLAVAVPSIAVYTSKLIDIANQSQQYGLADTTASGDLAVMAVGLPLSLVLCLKGTVDITKSEI